MSPSADLRAAVTPAPAGGDPTGAAARAAAADAAVVARHPDLPGLALLLDADRLRAALVDVAGPGPAATAVLERVRVKPGAAVRAGVRLEDADRRPRVLATAHTAATAEVKVPKELRAAERAGLPRHHEPAAGLVLVPAAADRALRGLARLRPDTGDAVRLPREERHRAGRADDVVATTLSHNPGRRWVGRLDPVGGPTPEAPPLLLRLHAGARAELLPWQRGRGWTAADGTTGVVARLDEHVRRQPVTPRRREVGAARRRLDGALVSAAEGLGVLDDAWAERGRALAAALGPLLAAEPLRPAHGDLSPDQVVVDDGAAHVLDWDRAGLLPRGWDAASWLAAQRAVRPGDEPVALAGGPPPSGAVEAAALLVRAVEPFRRRHPAWPDVVAALLGRAEDVLGAVSP